MSSSLTLTYVVVVVVECLLGARAGPVPKAASLDEVKVLTYGVIQFNEALQHIYASTEGKMADILHMLSRHEGALQWLEREAGRVAEVDRHIKRVVRLLQAQMAGLQTEAEQTKSRLDHVEQEEAALKAEVAKLEAYLHHPPSVMIKELQERTVQHSNMLENLVDWTRNQRRHLENQEQQLSKLQRLVGLPGWTMRALQNVVLLS